MIGNRTKCIIFTSSGLGLLHAMCLEVDRHDYIIFNFVQPTFLFKKKSKKHSHM